MLKEYIENNGVDALTNTLGISVKEYDNFYVLNYSQIDSPKTNTIVRACRGTIITKDTYTIVCNPFGRFFNYGETGEQDIDWSDASVKEKVDGSLIKLWWNPIDFRWEIATRGTAFGESNVFDFGFTFRELFLRAIQKTEQHLQELANSMLDTYNTYLIEIACLENRVVTAYEGDQVVLLAIRDNETGEYQNAGRREKAFFSAIGVRQAKEFPLSSIEQVREASEALQGLQEGFVIYQRGEPVCKVKNPTYVLAHHLRGEGLTNKRVANLVWINEYKEYLNYFPQDAGFINPWVQAYTKMVGDIHTTYERTKDVESQKDFAMSVKDKSISTILFNMRKGFTLENGLSRVSESSYVSILADYLE